MINVVSQKSEYFKDFKVNRLGCIWEGGLLKNACHVLKKRESFLASLLGQV